ncbi:hypothetical protein K227x_18220 [Rubripirellula lacrimiformis]|uniref:Uncharacterized protein n=1 Tax=Rubripirellula lacrimiformis TaxID=1930273 RepID=A0A517N8G9_9BACT|nr:hypothetical protein [Rubripirellula lacrimiformis]QDT03439.1 hypothetical protein K227x_18220 [Rubripirellula lacrimiformis]
MHRISLAALVLVGSIACGAPAGAEDSTSILEPAETYLLRYKLQADEQIPYEVTHIAKTKTRIRGAEEVSNVHTVSQRHWSVTKATKDEMTFEHVVDSVEMTQQQGEAEELRWDSTTGEKPVAVFEKVAEQIGEKLSTISINARGQETSREDFGGTKATLGMGSLTLALPEEPVAVGATWSVPREVRTRTEEGEVKVIKIRELFTLEKVKTGVATLSVRSEPLTPIDDESVRAQVVQQLSNGQIRFDIDAGRMLSKQLDWDETVVGFQGANSLMEYRARMTEKLIDGIERTASRR